jgi:hypothetical protein
LSKKVIDLDELRMLAAQGVPDAAGVRATVWKVLDWLELPVFLAFALRLGIWEADLIEAMVLQSAAKRIVFYVGWP